MFPSVTTAAPLTLILGILLCAVGVGLVAYLVFVLLSAFTGSFGGFFERMAFRRYNTRCRHGDALLEKGDFASAVHVFAESFFLRPVRYDATLLSDIANYHTGILSRLLTIADEMGKGRARLPSLPDTDRLLAERLEIHRDYFRTLKKGNVQKIREIEHRLRTNERQVRVAINQLINEIRSSSEERVLYH